MEAPEIAFEFCISGVPLAHGAGGRPKWQQRIKEAAATAGAPQPLFAGELSAVIIYFHHQETRLDVDNFAKPILDALTGTVLEDDRLISALTVRKTRLGRSLVIVDPGPVLGPRLAAS